jgi:hypothetical protein
MISELERIELKGKRGFEMATEMKNQARERTDEALENTVMGADLVTGAAVTVAENVSRVVNHPTREAHKIERRGAQANRRLHREVSGFVEETGERIEAMMPEKIALAGIHAIKARARRKDLMGEFAYRTLKIFNGGLEAMLGTVTRLERATQPPARSTSSQEVRKATRPVRKAARSTRRTAGSAVRSTRAQVRRSTSRARRTERASA